MNPLQSYEMQSLLQPGDVVIDAGANLGGYTVPFAERVGRAACFCLQTGLGGARPVEFVQVTTSGPVRIERAMGRPES